MKYENIIYACGAENITDEKSLALAERQIHLGYLSIKCGCKLSLARLPAPRAGGQVFY